MISISINETKTDFFGDLKDDIKGFDKFFHKLVSQVRNRIHARTKAGRDANDRKFKPYTKQYKKYKISKKKYEGAQPNLMWTGEMTKLSVDRIPNGYKIYQEICFSFVN